MQPVDVDELLDTSAGGMPAPGSEHDLEQRAHVPLVEQPRHLVDDAGGAEAVSSSQRSQARKPEIANCRSG